MSHRAVSLYCKCYYDNKQLILFLQALNFLRMGSRIDAVAQRVQTAVTTKQVTISLWN